MPLIYCLPSSSPASEVDETHLLEVAGVASSLKKSIAYGSLGVKSRGRFGCARVPEARASWIIGWMHAQARPSAMACKAAMSTVRQRSSSSRGNQTARRATRARSPRRR